MTGENEGWVKEGSEETFSHVRLWKTAHLLVLAPSQSVCLNRRWKRWRWQKMCQCLSDKRRPGWVLLPLILPTYLILKNSSRKQGVKPGFYMSSLEFPHCLVVVLIEALPVSHSWSQTLLFYSPLCGGTRNKQYTTPSLDVKLWSMAGRCETPPPHAPTPAGCRSRLIAEGWAETWS